MDRDSIKSIVKRFLSKPRYEHSLRVAETAQKCAVKWKADPEQAYTAGLVHDIAKELTPEKLLNLSIPLQAVELELYDAFPLIWHAFVGPIVVKHLLPQANEELLNTIKWHATGKENMTLLEQILYVGDYIEPGRSFHDIPFVRECVEHNLDEAVFAVSLASVHSLLRRGLPIHPLTLSCREWTLKRVAKERVKEISHYYYR